MSGHSHWAGIKHRKALTDSKRAGAFTKMARLITVAAREGGGNPDFNFKLKIVVQQARALNMPKDNIERSIKKGTGELKDAAIIEELIYEAYGPGQVAMLIKTLTDNRNRTLTGVKNILNKDNGKMVPEGSVSFLFSQSGYMVLDLTDQNRDEIELKAIDAGADDISEDNNLMTIYIKPEKLPEIRKKFEGEESLIQEEGITFIASQKIKLSEKDNQKYQTLLDALESSDDVQEIFDNLE
jgi:YebC/PmpR family DNA-binding regulatory protein